MSDARQVRHKLQWISAQKMKKGSVKKEKN